MRSTLQQRRSLPFPVRDVAVTNAENATSAQSTGQDVFVCGEARSHCVNSTVRDLVAELRACWWIRLHPRRFSIGTVVPPRDLAVGTLARLFDGEATPICFLTRFQRAPSLVHSGRPTFHVQDQPSQGDTLEIVSKPGCLAGSTACCRRLLTVSGAPT